MSGQVVNAIDKNVTDEPVTLPTYNVTVTATRTMEDIVKTPSSVSVVTAEDIEARRADTVADALQIKAKKPMAAYKSVDLTLPIH
ncbi:hypothetical protein [Veillonella parvula]